jgi:hypothetical protein
MPLSTIVAALNAPAELDEANRPPLFTVRAVIVKGEEAPEVEVKLNPALAKTVADENAKAAFVPSRKIVLFDPLTVSCAIVLVAAIGEANVNNPLLRSDRPDIANEFADMLTVDVEVPMAPSKSWPVPFSKPIDAVPAEISSVPLLVIEIALKSASEFDEEKSAPPLMASVVIESAELVVPVVPKQSVAPACNVPDAITRLAFVPFKYNALLAPLTISCVMVSVAGEEELSVSEALLRSVRVGLDIELADTTTGVVTVPLLPKKLVPVPLNAPRIAVPPETSKMPLLITAAALKLPPV